jgi:hypothetical protein
MSVVIDTRIAVTDSTEIQLRLHPVLDECDVICTKLDRFAFAARLREKEERERHSVNAM